MTRGCVPVHIDVSEVLIKFHNGSCLEFTCPDIAQRGSDSNFISEFPERAAQARGDVPTESERMRSRYGGPWA